MDLGKLRRLERRVNRIAPIDQERERIKRLSDDELDNELARVECALWENYGVYFSSLNDVAAELRRLRK